MPRTMTGLTLGRYSRKDETLATYRALVTGPETALHLSAGDTDLV